MPPVGFLPQAAVWSTIQRFAFGYSFSNGFQDHRSASAQHKLPGHYRSDSQLWPLIHIVGKLIFYGDSINGNHAAIVEFQLHRRCLCWTHRTKSFILWSSQIFNVFFCQPTCSSKLPFLRIGWCQLEAKASFTDFMVWQPFSSSSIRRHSDGYSWQRQKPVFERRVVGVDFNHIVCIGEKRYWLFSALDKNLFRKKIFPFFISFANSTPA